MFLAELIDNLHLHLFSGSFLTVLGEAVKFNLAKVLCAYYLLLTKWGYLFKIHHRPTNKFNSMFVSLFIMYKPFVLKCI